MISSTFSLRNGILSLKYHLYHSNNVYKSRLFFYSTSSRFITTSSNTRTSCIQHCIITIADIPKVFEDFSLLSIIDFFCFLDKDFRRNIYKLPNFWSVL
ncbi:hypothetical protein CW304_22125 [Bacillus sp. UFRGS-B20]|nr:hypothetical protein CW304_22125 [Bacillus sp. UFRGS-B20]